MSRGIEAAAATGATPGQDALTEHIRALVAAAPRLNPSQRDRLAVLLDTSSQNVSQKPKKAA